MESAANRREQSAEASQLVVVDLDADGKFVELRFGSGGAIARIAKWMWEEISSGD